jgi:beta-xylosidase
MNKSFRAKILPVKFLFVLVLCNGIVPGRVVAQDTMSHPIHLADPAVLHHDGRYFLYGTVDGNTNHGFVAYTSTDGKAWTKDTGFALKRGASYGKEKFWAPQVFQLNAQFYMAYAAEEHIAIAAATTPIGPFVQKLLRPLAAPVKQIDPFVFIDTDGKKYLYHVRLTKGNRIFVAEMEDDLSAIKPATLTECITATDQWENSANTGWPVTEGPSVLKHNDLYYLIYTANDFRNPDYAVGYATAKTPYGPWTKYAGNPIMSRHTLGVNGTGHGDFFRDGAGNLKYVFHTHFSSNAVGPRKTAWVDARFVPIGTSGMDKLEIVQGSFRFLTTGNE